MSIRVALRHTTRYRYDRLVEVGPHVIRLRPAPHCRTPILSYSLRIRPAAHYLNWQQDPQSNYLARVVFPEPTRELTVDVDLVAEMTAINPFDFFLESVAEQYPFEYEASLAEEIAPFRKTLPAGPALGAWLEGIDRSRRRTIDFLVGCQAAGFAA